VLYFDKSAGQRVLLKNFWQVAPAMPLPNSFAAPLLPL
jgi:hypothetical protein